MYVALEIRGEFLSPEKVTSIFGIRPSESFSKGDVYSSGAGSRKSSFEYGAWRLYSYDFTNSNEIEDHINVVVEKLSKLDMSINEIQGVENAWIDFFYQIKKPAEKDVLGNTVLKATLLKTLIRHGLDIVISYDVYTEI